MGEVISQNFPTSPLIQAQGEVVLHRIYRKNIKKKHISSKLRDTFHGFKFVVLSL